MTNDGAISKRNFRCSLKIRVFSRDVNTSFIDMKMQLKKVLLTGKVDCDLEMLK